MSVPAITGLAGVAATSPSAGLETIGLRTVGVTPSDAAGFGASLASAVEGLTAAQHRAGALAVQAVTGELEDVHTYTIAATEAQVALELTVAIRNKAVDAFNEIMRMQA